MAVLRLYVKLTPAPGARATSRRVIDYFLERKALLAEMGVRVEGVGVPAGRLRRSPRLVRALERRGVTALPALATEKKVYVGEAEIRRAIDSEVARFRRAAEPPSRRAVATAAADPLEDYYATATRGGDWSEEGIGEEAGDISNRVADEMRRRNESQAARRPVPVSAPAPADEPRAARDNLPDRRPGGHAAPDESRRRRGDGIDREMRQLRGNLDRTIEGEENDERDSIFEQRYRENSGTNDD